MEGKRDDKISMSQVRELVRQLETEYQVDIKLEMVPGPAAPAKFDWWVTVWSTPRTLARGSARLTHHQQHQWPSLRAKTLAGLLYNLLWQLDRLLADEQRDAERLTAGPQARMF